LKPDQSFSIPALLACVLLIPVLAQTCVTTTKMSLVHASPVETAYRVSVGKLGIAPDTISFDWKISNLRNGWFLLPRFKKFP